MRLWDGYDVMNSPEEFVETAWSAMKTRGSLLGNASPTDYANANLFAGSNGLDADYNLWDADGDQLIDPSTGTFRSGVNRRYTPDTWSDVLFQSAKRTETSLRFSGGNDGSTYFTSLSYLDDEGYYLNSDFSRITGRTNITNTVKEWLKSTVNMSFMRSESNYGGGQDEDSNNGFWLVDNMPSVYPVYGRDASGAKVIDPILETAVFDYGDGSYGTRRFASLTNAAATSTYDVVKQINNQFSGKTGLEARFLKDFTFTSDFGVEYLNTAYTELGNPFYGGSSGQGGSIYKVKGEYLAWTMTNMLRWSKAFGDHNISAFIAQEASAYEYHRTSNFKSKLADPFGEELNNAIISSPASGYTIARTLESYFGQVIYDYQSKYFLQLVVRRDGSSKFINEKWGTFGSIGGAWLVSNESFFSPLKPMVNEMKLKASYGIIGEQGGIDSYSGFDLFSIGNLNDELSFAFDSKGNKDLTWEESRQTQVGAEFKLFNRVTGSVDYYNKLTTNLLYPKRVAPSSGYAIIQVNDGEMVNSGLEVQLRGDLYNGNDLTISLGVNAAFEHNEITHMPIDNATGEEKILDKSGIYGRTAGRSLYDIYTREYAGVDAATGAAQWWSYYNELADGTKEYFVDYESYMAENEGNIGTIGKEKTDNYSLATSKFIDKSPIPTVRGSFDLSASYKGFTISALFAYSLGGYGYDGNYAALMDDGLIGGNNWHKDMHDAWQEPGDVTDVPAITGGLSTSGADAVNYSNANRTSDRFVTKTDYLALNNVRISYDFSEKFNNKIGLKGLRIFAAGDNLWVTTKRAGFYPNLSEVGGSSRYQYVALTTFTAGINIKF
jgi:TonB-linked SusC/RagA family outer membrane protein